MLCPAEISSKSIDQVKRRANRSIPPAFSRTLTMNQHNVPTVLEVEASMNRRICRQVLDCGDGVREVTALAVTALKIPKRGADTTRLTQSGDSEDSVAAVQDARAPTRAALGSWSQCSVEETDRIPGKKLAGMKTR